jgi:hypothetical protein
MFSPPSNSAPSGLDYDGLDDLGGFCKGRVKLSVDDGREMGKVIGQAAEVGVES